MRKVIIFKNADFCNFNTDWVGEGALHFLQDSSNSYTEKKDMGTKISINSLI